MSLQPGILHNGKHCVIGNGVVMDSFDLMKELEAPLAPSPDAEEERVVDGDGDHRGDRREGVLAKGKKRSH